MSTNRRMFKRILAFVLAILLFINALPQHMLMVSATAVDSYIILLDGMQEEEKKEGIAVTLTNKENEGEKQTARTDTEGKAVFENFIDSEKTYLVNITGRIGYEDYKGELTSEDLSETEVTLDLSETAELEKIILQGTVADKEGKPVSDASVTYSAYEGKLTNDADTIRTDEAGTYFFEIYKGIEYSILVSKEGYQMTSDEPVKITAKDGENGNIVVDEEGNKVQFEAVARIYLEDKEYLLLAPMEDKDSEDIYVFRIDEVDGKQELNLVEDDKEFIAVKKEYSKLLY